MFPFVNMCTERRFFPLRRRTLKRCEARFQWCHWRQAHVSAESWVDVICRGPVASFPFTSTDIVPPRFDVYRKSAAYVPACVTSTVVLNHSPGSVQPTYSRSAGGTTLLKGLSSIGSGFRSNFV